MYSQGEVSGCMAAERGVRVRVRVRARVRIRIRVGIRHQRMRGGTP